MPRHIVADDSISLLQGYIPMQGTAPDASVSTFWVDTSTSPPKLMGWNSVDEAWVESAGAGGGGSGTDATWAGFSVRRTTAFQPPSYTYMEVAWEQVDWDDEWGIDLATENAEFTVPETGRYLLSLQVNFTRPDRHMVRVELDRQDGSGFVTEAIADGWNTSNRVEHVQLVRWMELTAGWKVRAMVQTEGVEDVNADHTVLQMHRLCHTPVRASACSPSTTAAGTWHWSWLSTSTAN